jgi:hypothetical protein
MGEKHLWKISRITWVSCFAPWILLLHKPLSFASAGGRAPLLTSSSNIFIHVFPGLTDSGSITLHLQPSAFLHPDTIPLSLCMPNHLNLFIMHTSLIGSIPILALSSALGTLSLNDTPHFHPIILISVVSRLDSFSTFRGQVSLPCHAAVKATLVHFSFPPQGDSFCGQEGSELFKLVPCTSDCSSHCGVHTAILTYLPNSRIF